MWEALEQAERRFARSGLAHGVAQSTPQISFAREEQKGKQNSYNFV